MALKCSFGVRIALVFRVLAAVFTAPLVALPDKHRLLLCIPYSVLEPLGIGWDNKGQHGMRQQESQDRHAGNASGDPVRVHCVLSDICARRFAECQESFV